MAEGLFRQIVAGSDYEVQSAGIAAYPGQAASPHTLSLLREEGIDISYFRSQPLTERLVSDATHIFVMTAGHRDAIEAQFPAAADKTYLLCEFCPDPCLLGRDVPDPIGLGREAYAETLAIFKKALSSVFAFIEQTFDKKKAP